MNLRIDAGSPLREAFAVEIPEASRANPPSGRGIHLGMNRGATPLLLSALLLVATGGCVHYEYDVVQPPELARHVGTKQWTSFQRDALEYRLRTSDDRLVMLIYNRGERTVKLSGPDSATVDPSGESHPLQSRAVPRDSYVKLILPPPPPQVRSYGPTMGFGVGVGYGRRFGGPYHDGLGFGSGMYDDVEPRYYSVYDPNDRTYFTWPGDSDLRLLLTFQEDGGGSFRHEFVLRRRKM